MYSLKCLNVMIFIYLVSDYSDPLNPLNFIFALFLHTLNEFYMQPKVSKSYHWVCKAKQNIKFNMTNHKFKTLKINENLIKKKKKKIFFLDINRILCSLELRIA